jgi:hypothetical protein
LRLFFVEHDEVFFFQVADGSATFVVHHYAHLHEARFCFQATRRAVGACGVDAGACPAEALREPSATSDASKIAMVKAKLVMQRRLLFISGLVYRRSLILKPGGTLADGCASFLDTGPESQGADFHPRVGH